MDDNVAPRASFSQRFCARLSPLVRDKWHRLYLMAILSLVVGMIFVACGEERSQEYKDNLTVSTQQNIYGVGQPIHVYDYSLEKDIFQQIYDMRNVAVNTYSVAISQTGAPQFACPSRGFPIPYDTQLTNPLQPYRYSNGSYSNGLVVEQAEPNGLFSSKNTHATWILCIRGNGGEVAPVYSEPDVMSFPFPVVYQNGMWVEMDTNVPASGRVVIPNNVDKIGAPKVTVAATETPRR